jgi:hypothetical protein
MPQDDNLNSTVNPFPPLALTTATWSLMTAIGATIVTLGDCGAVGG